jgi:hypothetical protein
MGFLSVYGTSATMNQATITTLASQSASISAVTFNSAHGVTFSVNSATVSSWSFLSGTGIAGSSFGIVSATVSSMGVLSGQFTSLSVTSATISSLAAISGTFTEVIISANGLAPLGITRTGGNFNITMTSYNDASTSPGFLGQKARGSDAVPLPITADDYLFAVSGRGYLSELGFPPGVSPITLGLRASEVHTSVAYGTHFRFETTKCGTTIRVEQARVLDTGQLLIGRTIPNTTSLLETDSAALSVLRVGSGLGGSSYLVPNDVLGSPDPCMIVGVVTVALTSSISVQAITTRATTAIGLVAAVGGSPALIGYGIGGTITALAAVSRVENLLVMGGGGYASPTLLTGTRANILFRSTDAWTSDSTPADIRFSTTAAGTNAARYGMSLLNTGVLTCPYGIDTPYYGVTTAITTATTNNQMTISQNTLGVTFRVQGSDGIWRTGTLALLSL